MTTSTLHFVLLVSAVVAGVNSMLCGYSHCQSGEDCLSLGGSLRCADPCLHYSHLNDTWRSTNISSRNQQLHCDRDLSWQGWYRMFLHGNSVPMPETCVDKWRCGTHASLWLAESHPELNDGVVERRVCGHWAGDCCWSRSNPIHVKACHGDFYVYKFVKPTGCRLAYCADAACETCGNNDICVRINASLTCRARQDHVAAKVQPTLLCGRRIFQLGLPGSYFEDEGLNASSAHMAEPRCSALQQRNGTMWYQVERTAGICGNGLTTNGTHATYSNTLFVYPKDGMAKSSVPDPVTFSFSCIYPLDTETSLQVAVGRAIVGVGPRARASMSLYRTPNFTAPYPAGPVAIPLGATLYVGVAVDETDANRFVVVLEDCYATHNESSDDPNKYFLIQNRCATNGSEVWVTENGSSLQAYFSARLVLFRRDVATVANTFLHCSLVLRDRSHVSDSPSCRLPRSVSDDLPLNPLTIGPISWE